jgi:hypothetical protein
MSTEIVYVANLLHEEEAVRKPWTVSLWPYSEGIARHGAVDERSQLHVANMR